MVGRRVALISLMAIALSSQNGVFADDTNCLVDGGSCVGESCPPSCCSGIPIRVSGFVRHCPPQDAIFPGGTLPAKGTSVSGNSDSQDALTDHSHSAASGSDNSPSTTAPPPGASSQNDDAPAPTSAPEATVTSSPDTPSPSSGSSFKGSSENVDSFQSATALSNGRGVSGSTTAGIVVAALVGCVVLVAAVMYKRKNNPDGSQSPMESDYKSSGADMTPDNRSLDGILESGFRGTTGTSKTIAMSSTNGHRESGPSASRASSPFGLKNARVSSPAHVRDGSEDMTFNVDQRGSAVQIAFVGKDREQQTSQDGLVAL